MTLALTQFGDRMSHLTGVRAIMKDIIETLNASKASNSSQEFINLSAGNPVILPEVEQLWRDCTADLLASPEAIRDDFNVRYGLQLTSRNILITPGSQNLYFLAANALGGYSSSGQLKDIVLPLSPDYTGYGGVTLYPEALKAYRPFIELGDDPHSFKYRPDFNQLEINENTGFVLFSRPCNPTGNVITDDEVQGIVDLATPYDVPVFIDSAYAPPFPALNFTEMTPVFGPNIVHCISLSKAGLPGERVGIAIGDEKIIQILEAFQTNMCIHSSRYGQAIAARAIRSGALADIAENVIRPHYRNKFAVLEDTLIHHMPNEVPWRLHRGEGAIFAWLWFDNLPMTDWEFYNELKKYGVIIVPGSPFFPGLKENLKGEDWPHMRQCFRISLTATEAQLVTALKHLATLTDKVYSAQPAMAAV
jgi:valine--pyruvate aminotransferase